ncbi:hypothetical protein Lal_00007453 [Lupinus albus]|uniref:Putative filament-like plant protein n=1 Tax=Lupinus albus TaxID=3870 RepID=A0A6A5MQM4_LUPAL|nr:putative filament-like plant protein [Lupinus albus]KAF1874838.1 hypothetical protein Lal_00007453 [Lupinus albus]
MNHKPWHWRKRSMEKTIFAVDKDVSPSRIIEEEVHKFPIDKETGGGRSSRSLNQKSVTVLLDCHDGDDPSSKHAQKSQQEIRDESVGKETAKQEAESSEDLYKEISAEIVTPPTDTKLWEPLQPLKCVQEDSNISKEHEKIHEFEEKLREQSKKIYALTAENTCLTNALVAKEKSVVDLLKCKQQSDAEFGTLMARLDSTEKENAFLRYEFHMLEKELEIQKEEMDYSRRYADASHKKYVENAHKASKLEAECQRLRLTLHKRSPGPAGLVIMKNEVGMMTNMRRIKSSPARDLIYKNNDIRNSTEVSEKTIGLMMNRLQDLDEENKALKRILTQKNTELDSSRVMYVETTSRLSQAEILLRKLCENQKSMELERCYPNPTSNELPLISNFDLVGYDGTISSGSWLNARISELEHLRTSEGTNHKKNKAIDVPDMSLMDDFVEMEKSAIVSVGRSKREYCSDVSGRELVPVEQDLGCSERKQEMQFKYTTAENSFDWLQVVLKAILEEKRISKRSHDELFEDIKIALGYINYPTASKTVTHQNSRHPGEADSCSVDSFSGVAEVKGNQHFDSSLTKSVHKIIKLIEGIAPKSYICKNYPDCFEENQHSNISQSVASKEYFVHVFQWKLSNLNPLLHRLVHTCKDLLTGRADYENFVEEVAFSLDWSINNCATSTNSSIARDNIKKHFSCHLSQNENQIDFDDKQSFHSPRVAYPDDQCMVFDTKNNQYDLREENIILKEDLRNTKSAMEDLEAKLLSVTNERQNLTKQFQEAQNSIKGLESEIEILEESKRIIEDQIEKQKLINEDLDTQLTIAHAKLNGIFQKVSSLEVELDDKKNSCEELEATCLELQLQLESIVKKESPAYGRHDMEKIYQTGWEITTASSKLAEYQETILNLGKQLKALASSSETVLLDRVVSTTSTVAIANPTQKKNLLKRRSLLNHMQAEDDAKAGGSHESVQNEETKSTKGSQKPLLQSENDSAMQTPKIMVIAPGTSLSSDQNDRSNAAGSLAIVPSKKEGGFGFLRKLFLRRKKRKGKAKHD